MSTSRDELGDALFALSNPHQRSVLVALRDCPARNEGVSHGTLVDAVHDGDRDRDDVALTLTHHHLPTLEMLGYASWDRQTGTVSRGPRWDSVEPVLELLADQSSLSVGGAA